MVSPFAQYAHLGFYRPYHAVYLRMPGIGHEQELFYCHRSVVYSICMFSAHPQESGPAQAADHLTDTFVLKNIPHSYPVFPRAYRDRGMYVFWRVIRPFHNPVRDALLSLGLIWHASERQPYLLGHIAPGHSPKTLTEHLVNRGWGNHFIAWEDTGQVVSLRYTEDFHYQYHLRIFQDGEVRGHYEYTPEAHIVWHMRQTDMEPRRDFFLRALEGRVIPVS